MNLHHASRFAVVTLISLLPAGACFAEPPATVSDADLASVGERIRQTGAQMREDLKYARERLEAQKAQQEAERKREAERARQQAAEQAAIKEAKQRQAQEAAQAQARREAASKAEHDRQIALAAQREKDERLAREKAAKALADARQSSSPKGLADESARERAARALREARQSAAGPKAMADSGL